MALEKIWFCLPLFDLIGASKMESLAIVVVMLFLIALLAGPISIGLSSRFIQSRLSSQASLGVVILNLLRKAFHLLLVAFGTLIGVQFLFIAGLPLIPRVIGLFAVVTCYIGLRRVLSRFLLRT